MKTTFHFTSKGGTHQNEHELFSSLFKQRMIYTKAEKLFDACNATYKVQGLSVTIETKYDFIMFLIYDDIKTGFITPDGIFKYLLSDIINH